MKKILLFTFTCILFLISKSQQLVMETGSVVLNHNTTTVSLNNTFVDPVVIALPPTYNGPNESTTRLDNVSGTGFDIFLEEPNGRDGTHTNETVHYIVIEKGNYTFPDGTMLEAGTISSSNLSFQSINFLQTYGGTPAVFTHVQTDNSNTRFLKTRQRNSSTTGFEVKLERDESTNSTNPSQSEEIGYFAITSDTGALDDVKFDAGSFSATHTTVTNNFQANLSSGNLFIASIATFNGSDPAGIRLTGLTENSASLFIEEDISSDTGKSHASETINFFSINGNSSAGIFIPSILPIELLSFTAKQINVGRTHLIEWTTAVEINNERFELYQAGSELLFEKIHTISGAGTTNNIINYEYENNELLDGDNYYLLKQIDFDGTTESFKIIHLKNTFKEKQVIIFPNPVRPECSINIKNVTSEYYGANLYNANGQLSGSIRFHTLENIIKAPSTPGTYFLQILQKDGDSTSHIILVE